MSSLYIRVRTNFYTHRKTMKLRAAIGDDAFWIPPRLWAYAAEHQPDGDFSSYSSIELAMLIGCEKHKDSIKQALLDAGYLDASSILHDWDEHNGYHKKFSERASNAAKARWSSENSGSSTGKEKDKERDKDKDQAMLEHRLSNASSIYEAYPRKEGRPAAIRSILKALKQHSFDFLLERTKLFAEARQAQDPKFTPHPATWFNQERFLDDPAGWAPPTFTPQPPRKRLAYQP